MNAPLVNRFRVKMLWGMGALLGVQLIGTLGYKLLGGPGYSWFDCFYMTFITTTTIGYDEIIDLSHISGGRMFTVFIGAAGLGSLWFLFSTLTVWILESDINLALRRKRMEQAIKKLKGHYIVCGYGRVGRNVALELEATHRRYVVIDESMPTLREHKDKEPTLLYVHGDASDEDLLLAANIASAKGVFAVTGDDSRNLMITLTARQLNASLRVVARCHDIRNEESCARPEPMPSSHRTSRVACASPRPWFDPMCRPFWMKCCAASKNSGWRKYDWASTSRRSHWPT